MNWCPSSSLIRLCARPSRALVELLRELRVELCTELRTEPYTEPLHVEVHPTSCTVLPYAHLSYFLNNNLTPKWNSLNFKYIILINIENKWLNFFYLKN